MGGFEISSKLDVREAFQRFPEQRLALREDGQLKGNIIVDSNGEQHPLDTHEKSEKFDRRVRNYVVGTNVISLTTAEEIAVGRQQTVEVLSEILKRKGSSPKDIVSRFGCKLTESQVHQLRAWLVSIKQAA